MFCQRVVHFYIAHCRSVNKQSPFIHVMRATYVALFIRLNFIRGILDMENEIRHANECIWVIFDQSRFKPDNSPTETNYRLESVNI